MNDSRRGFLQWLGLTSVGLASLVAPSRVQACFRRRAARPYCEPAPLPVAEKRGDRGFGSVSIDFPKYPNAGPVLVAGGGGLSAWGTRSGATITGGIVTRSMNGTGLTYGTVSVVLDGTQSSPANEWMVEVHGVPPNMGATTHDYWIHINWNDGVDQTTHSLKFQCIL